jgi:hypothetical protein
MVRSFYVRWDRLVPVVRIGQFRSGFCRIGQIRSG